jgi:hypothetical protein
MTPRFTPMIAAWVRSVASNFARMLGSVSERQSRLWRQDRRRQAASSRQTLLARRLTSYPNGDQLTDGLASFTLCNNLDQILARRESCERHVNQRSRASFR